MKESARVHVCACVSVCACEVRLSLLACCSPSSLHRRSRPLAASLPRSLRLRSARALVTPARNGFSAPAMALLRGPPSVARLSSVAAGFLRPVALPLTSFSLWLCLARTLVVSLCACERKARDRVEPRWAHSYRSSASACWLRLLFFPAPLLQCPFHLLVCVPWPSRKVGRCDWCCSLVSR